MFFEDAQKNKKIKEGKPKIFVVGFSTWKTYLRMYFSEYDLIFMPKDIKKNQFNSQYRKQIVSLKDSCQVFIWGFKAPEYILEFLREEKISTKFVEDGFVRSVQLGATKAPPMSLCLDSKTPYFDATRPSELEDLLNNFDFTSKPELIDQAKEGINLLLETGVSKYNNSEKVSIEKFYGPKTKKRILVLGQVEDDASIQYGCEKKLTNNDVVRLAAEENPGAQIIYKPHPDVMNGHRPYQSNPTDVENIALVLKKDVPLSNAFETVDHVYTMTSLGGFEALLRGIKVTALGSPFYAGWGLTDDRQANERRKRQLTIEQLFAIAYLVYPKYFEPENGRSIKFEEVVATIKQLHKNGGTVYSLPPQPKETRFDGATIVFYINDWKRPILQSWFPEKNFIFVPIKTTDQQLKSNWLPKMVAARNAEIFAWGMNLNPLVKGVGLPITYIEDGFIRSVGLGALHTPPLSLNFDRQTPYFNANEPSDLENLLNSYDFTSQPGLLNRADELIKSLLTTKISKYNHTKSIDVHSVYGPKTKKRVLVIGQVEDDASIIYGSSVRYTNNDLVHIAALENPDAQILYKPHPDVLNRKREMLSDPNEVKHICQVIDQDIALAESFETIDHVYTITSLAGFEALLRQIPVTVMGCPFYAGWGLTDDRQPNLRRTRVLSIQELIAVAYIVYPKYFHPNLKKYITVEEAIDYIGYMRDKALNVKELERKKSLSLEKNKAEKVALANLKTMGYEQFGNNWQSSQLPIAILYQFQNWRWPQAKPFFEGYRLLFKPVSVKGDSEKEIEAVETVLNSVSDTVIVIWGMHKLSSVEELAHKYSSNVIRVEEGFIRGVALGASLAPPLSMAIDNVGMYFDSTNSSLLENILNTYDFYDDSDLLARSKRCIEQLLEKNISKYNYTSEGYSYYGEKNKKRILVLGQVEDDASIKYGCDKSIDNNGLVMLAALENPDADIYYKPHPDTLRGNRRLLSDPKDVEKICTVIYEKIPIDVAFEGVDHVYTITSLSGFEAILRNIKVTTYGAPFYSGWGLTDDRQTVDRRSRTLSKEEVFAAAYILYMQYRHPISGQEIELEEAISIMEWVKSHNINFIPKAYQSADIGSRYFSIAKKRLSNFEYEATLEEINNAIKVYPNDYRYYLLRIEASKALSCASYAIKNDFELAASVAPEAKKFTLIKNHIKYIWKVEGITKELRNVLAKLMAYKKIFKADDYMWLAALYCDAGYYTKAIQFYKCAYEKDRTVTQRNTYLKLTSLVLKTAPELVENSNWVEKIYNKIERSSGIFEDLVGKANSIAIVGNSPIEIGKGLGASIDKHELVIRFNNFSTSSEFRSDYGSKTDVWIKAGYFDLMSRRSVEEFKLIVQPMGDMVHRDPKACSYVLDYVDNDVMVEFFDPVLSYELYHILGAQPSSGIMVLYYIYKIIGKIPEKSVFGFAFVDQAKGSTGYTHRVKAGKFYHNWQGELDLFNKIVG